VAGISPTCTEQTIRSALSQFGTVEDVKLVGQNDDTLKKKRKRNPYCFVTFDDAISARRAVDAPLPHPQENYGDDDVSAVYKEIKYATPITTITRSSQSRAREAEKLSQIESYGQQTNLVVQVQSSHLDRLVAYFHRWNDSQNNNNQSTNNRGGNHKCEVLGSVRTNSKNLSLLLLACDNAIDVARGLYANPFLARAINKSYIVQPRIIEGNLSTEQGCSDFAKVIHDEIQRVEVLSSNGDDDDNSIVCRMQVFPPKHQARLVQSIGNLVNKKTATNAQTSKKFTISPRGFTHMLSIVEVHRYKGRDWKHRLRDENNNLYMMGLSPATNDLDVVDTNNIIGDGTNGDEVSRAYYKLKEALEMYETSRGELPRELYGSIALDCGSAPGGWTKYLVEHFGCGKVYSVDPGELAPSVREMEVVEHMQIKIQDALPKLLDDKASAGRVKIWVSDMCLHNMGAQVDLLLSAKEQGVMAPNAFFVLTLKCIVGHSKLSYDAQVERVVDKVRRDANNVDGVETFHLFSNRSGERTVIGYLT